MKKFLFLSAAAVLSASTAFSQCNTGGTNYGSAPAPCVEVGPVSADIAGFEVWRGDIYEITDVQAGASYSIDICQGTGGLAWTASLSAVAPSGAIDAFGTDAGSPCELSFTATESGTYQMFVNEVGECPGVSQGVDNGSPRVTYFSGGSCLPPVTTCEAGVNNGVSVPVICPAELTVLAISGMIVPNSPTAGDAFIEFTPTDPLNVSGLGGPFVLTGFSAVDLAGYGFDNDLNGVLSSNLFPVMEGEWTIKGFVTSVTGSYFDPLTRCDSTDAVATVTFLTSADAGCVPVTTCEAGILDQAAIDGELCPQETTDYIVTGFTLPNSPVAGEYILEFTPVPGSGAGGPFGVNPDPSFVLTIGAPAGTENGDFTIVLDNELLNSTGVVQPAMTGDWSVRGAVFAGGISACDSVPAVVINFKTAAEFPCGGPAPCENPFPAVDESSLSLVNNPSGSITFSWAPVLGQIGCQVNARIGDPVTGTPNVSFIVGGAGASSFTANAGALAPYQFSPISFRVRCGCQQGPTIAGPFSSQLTTVIGLSANPIIAMTPEFSADRKNFIGQTGGLQIASSSELVNGFPNYVNTEAGVQGTISKAATKTRTSFDVFPNPSSGAVNLKYAAVSEGLVNVRVFDMVGKAVADFNMAVSEGSNFLNLDLSSLDKGIYVIEVLEGQMSSTSKVVMK
ncbi:MAG: hypothetical protein ACJAQ4_001676 [Cryomorphaceae bacterium]|jgi:hypothetical protein